MPSTWQKKLTDELDRANVRVRNATVFFKKYRKLLRKYAGGMHVGFLAAIAEIESGGNIDAVGDAALGEYGFFQIAENTPAQFGLPSNFRKTPEGNIFIAALEYNTEAARLVKRYPLIRHGSSDQWMLARLVFAIGRRGTYSLLDAAKPKTRQVYSELSTYVDSVGGAKLGSQSAGKVWFRVKHIPIVWQIGEKVAVDSVGLPTKIKSPKNVVYFLPKDIRGSMRTGFENTATAIGLTALTLVVPGV